MKLETKHYSDGTSATGTAPDVSGGIKLADLRCCDCGSAEIMSVSPGAEPLSAVGIAYEKGEPCKAWCSRCWWKMHGADPFSVPETK